MLNSPTPNFPAGERSLLGAIMYDNDVLQKAQDAGITTQDFYTEAHRNLFHAYERLASRDMGIDLTTVTSELVQLGQFEQFGGSAYLIEVLESAGGIANAMHYATIIKEKSVLRSIIGASQKIISQCYLAETEELDTILNNIEELSVQAAHARVANGKGGSKLIHISEILKSTLRDIEAKYEQRVSPFGLKTGFSGLDDTTGGLRGGEVLIVAGRPGMGKTAFALAVASEVPPDACAVIFSLEMDAEQNTQRLLARNTAINLRNIRTGQLGQSDFDKLITRSGDMSERTLFINDTSTLTPTQIRFQLRSLTVRHRRQIGLVIVDYLQLMSPSKRCNSREETIASISRDMKCLAKDFATPIILLCQLNRELEKRSDKRPILSDLRESGSIEQDADLVIGLYQPYVYTKREEDRGLAEAIVLKHRNGPTGTIPLRWVGETATYWGTQSMGRF